MPAVVLAAGLIVGTEAIGFAAATLAREAVVWSWSAVAAKAPMAATSIVGMAMLSKAKPSESEPL